jgi:hypothetical protein
MTDDHRRQTHLEKLRNGEIGEWVTILLFD